MSLDKKELNILKKKIVTVFAFFEHNVKDIRVRNIQEFT
jgi:hypothetical protein